jgi:hypothetical protein
LVDEGSSRRGEDEAVACRFREVEEEEEDLRLPGEEVYESCVNAGDISGGIDDEEGGAGW